MELTLDQALKKGIEAHKAGKAQEADRYYTAILKANPKHPDANHNMGVLAVGVSKVEEALPFFKTALKANPDIAQYWLSYINALIKLDRIADAKTALNQAKNKGTEGDGFEQIEQRIGSSQNPDVVDSLNVQDPSQEQQQALITLYGQGQYQEVLNRASQLQDRFPNSVVLYNIIGTINQSLGKLDEAIEVFKQTLSIKPDSAEVNYNMGNALRGKGKPEEALDLYRKAISFKPNYVKAFLNIGIILKEQGKLEEAIEFYNKALLIKPDFAETYNNLGNALLAQGKLEEAIKAYTNALAINPKNADIIENASSIRVQISEPAFINEQIEKIIESHSLDLIEMPKFRIQQAIRAFILSSPELVRKHLNIYNRYPPSSIAKLKSKDQVFCSAYNSFLQ